MKKYGKNKFHTVCYYWKNPGLTCKAGDNCLYVHNYICEDDGRCEAQKCNYAHFKQRRPVYLNDGKHNKERESPERRRRDAPYLSRDSRSARSPYYRSRRSNSRSPYHRMRRSYSRSPKHGRSRSPRSQSPKRRYSRSPRSQSPKRRYSRSPRSQSPKRGYSRSPRRKKSYSPRDSRSPGDSKSYNKFAKSPIRRSYSRSPKDRHNHSPKISSPSARHSPNNQDHRRRSNYSPDNASPNSKQNSSPSRSLHKQFSISSFFPSSKSPGNSPKRHKFDDDSRSLSPHADNSSELNKRDSISSLFKTILSDNGSGIASIPNENSSVGTSYGGLSNDLLEEYFAKAFKKNTSENEQDYSTSEIKDASDADALEMFTSLNVTNEAVKKPSSLSPSSQACEILKNIPKNFGNKVIPSASTKEDVFRAPDSLRENPLKNALMKILNSKTENAPTKTTKEPIMVKKNPTDIYQFTQLLEKNLSPPRFGSTLWTPALDRQKITRGEAPAPPQLFSDWDIDTPYISRKGRAIDNSLSEKKAKNSPKTKQKSDSFDFHMDDLSHEESLDPPYVSKTRREPEPQQKQEFPVQQKRHCFSVSSTSSEEEPEKETFELGQQSPDNIPEQSKKELFLQKKKLILSRVWQLMEQKKKLDDQRGNIVRTHKSKPKTCAPLLNEVDKLRKEVDRQILHMNKSIREINSVLNVDLDLSVLPSCAVSASNPSLNSSNLLQDLKDKTDSIALKSVGKSKSKAKERQSTSSPESKSKRKSSKSRSRRSKSRDEDIESESIQKRKEKKISSMSKKNSDGMMFKKPLELDKDQEYSKEKETFKKPNESGKNKKKSDSSPKSDQYAPSLALKPNIKYIDQGFHWCKECNDFKDTASHFIDHLEELNHLFKSKKSKNLWLAKAPQPIKKDDTAPLPGAPLLTIPLQGMEFMHSVAVFYCSLCEKYIHHKEEASIHCETNLHVSRYKDHLAKNPLYETSYGKDKMAAFARYSVAKEKTKNSSLNEQQIETSHGSLPFNTSVKPEKCESDSDSLVDISAEALGPSSIPMPSCNSAISFIREEDQCPKGQNSTNEDSQRQESTLTISEPSKQDDTNDMKNVVSQATTLPKGVSSNREKLEVLKKKIKAEETSPSPPPSIFSLEETAAISKKPENKKASSKFSKGVMIGKIPCLRPWSRAKHPKPKEVSENKTQESLKKIDDNASQIGSDKQIDQAEKKQSKTSLETSSDASPSSNEDVSQTTTLPKEVPTGIEYITEINSSGKETKFTKVIGPTLSKEEEVSKEDPLSKKLIPGLKSPFSSLPQDKYNLHSDSNVTSLFSPFIPLSSSVPVTIQSTSKGTDVSVSKGPPVASTPNIPLPPPPRPSTPSNSQLLDSPRPSGWQGLGPSPDSHLLGSPGQGGWLGPGSTPDPYLLGSPGPSPWLGLGPPNPQMMGSPGPGGWGGPGPPNSLPFGPGPGPWLGPGPPRSFGPGLPPRPLGPCPPRHLGPPPSGPLGPGPPGPFGPGPPGPFGPGPPGSLGPGPPLSGPLRPGPPPSGPGPHETLGPGPPGTSGPNLHGTVGQNSTGSLGQTPPRSSHPTTSMSFQARSKVSSAELPLWYLKKMSSTSPKPETDEITVDELSSDTGNSESKTKDELNTTNGSEETIIYQEEDLSQEALMALEEADDQAQEGLDLLMAAAEEEN